MRRLSGRRAARVLGAAAGVAALAGLAACGGGGGERVGAEEPGVNLGLAGLLGEEAPAAAVESAPAEAEGELEALIAEQAAQLAEAYGTPREALEADPGEATAGDGADASLAQMLGDGGAAEEGASEVSGTEVAAEEMAPAVEATLVGAGAGAGAGADVETLSALLAEALGQELETTSEPFRTAVAMIALAAAQGQDPVGAIGPETRAGAALSPAERESALVVAEMLASVLSPGEAGETERVGALRDLADRLSRTMGLTVPVAALCTEVRGYGRYAPFPRNDFLARRPIRALLYVEVDRFEHRETDGSALGLPVEERFAIELSQTLELYHAGEGKNLAWKRGEEVVVETSRNKQRDFYLLTEIRLPETLTVGSYQLKVIIRDRVAGTTAERLIPVNIVADPALAWTAE